MSVRPKKHLGQHFLHDENIARKIVESLSGINTNILEIGPGMGMLTKYLLADNSLNVKVIEVDRESVEYLHTKFPQLENRIISADFLKTDISAFFDGQFVVIGNFPYNISTQIIFKVIENRDLVPEVVGMFQKEVAERIASKPGSKVYGITSVITQAFFDIEYLFTVSENVFNPPPKVKSAVIRLRRNSVNNLGCDEALFVDVIKSCFNVRRKTIRNGMKKFTIIESQKNHEIFNKRPEQLSVSEFVLLTNLVK